jgi:hypothetical protein
VGASTSHNPVTEIALALAMGNRLEKLKVTGGLRKLHNATKSIEQMACCEANSRSATKDISGIRWNTKLPYRVQRGTPLDPILSQMKPVHIIKTPT